jgi:hypothetical protein
MLWALEKVLPFIDVFPDPDRLSAMLVIRTGARSLYSHARHGGKSMCSMCPGLARYCRFLPLTAAEWHV